MNLYTFENPQMEEWRLMGSHQLPLTRKGYWIEDA